MAQKRPNPTSLLEGQPAVNINVSEPGLFFKATDGTLFKVGPVAITSGGSSPNAAAAGPSGNVAGETWLDGRTAYASPVMKVFNGTSWVASNGFQVDNTTGNFQLSKALTVSTLIANGTGANAYIRVPNGPVADESSITAAAGMIRFDTSSSQFRGFNGTNWEDLGSGDISGNLNVSGNSSISGSLTVLGSTTLGNDPSSDTLTVNSAANFTGSTTIGDASSDSLTVSAISDFRANVAISSQAGLRFHSGTIAGSSYVGFKAPSSISGNVLWTLPNNDGADGQVLTTNGTGALSWTASGSSVTVGDAAPTSPPPGNGDLWYNSIDGRLFVYYADGSSNQWVDVSPVSAGVTNIKILDDISAGFDGVTDTFNLAVSSAAITPVNAQQMMVIVGGVTQRAGTDYTVTGSQITFTTAPTGGLSFYAVIYGAAVTQNTVADNAVTTAKIQNGAVTVAKMDIDATIVPDLDNTHDLGSPTFRFANVYTGDLHLKNDRGDWTMIEDEDFLTLRNNKTGKVFKLLMEEI